MQQHYFGIGLNDIPWNFLVGGDGAIYEGRGFKFQGEIPIRSISSFIGFGYHIAFIGNFSTQNPSPDLVFTFENFLNNAVQREVLSEDYQIFLEDQLTLDKSVYGLLNVLRDNQKFYESKKIRARKFIVIKLKFLNILVLRIWSRSQWNADLPKDPSIMERLPVNVETVNARRMMVPFNCTNLVSWLTFVFIYFRKSP